MAYIVLADIEDAIGGEAALRKVTRSNPVDTDKVDKAIEFAESRINAYASGSGGFPFASVPDIAKQVALSLALYRLYTLSWPASDVPETVEQNYKQALLELEALSKGETSWVDGQTPARQNASKPFVFLPNSTASEDNPRRTLRKVRDLL